MSRREEYEQKTEAILTPIVESRGFELVDVEYVKEAGTWYLRGYIDKPGGITVNDCEDVSRAFSDILDEQDFIEDSYIMEISSPGLDRPLKKEKDFKRSLGKLVEIRTYRPIEKQKELGGMLRFISKEAHKEEVQRLLDYYLTQIFKREIEVLLNTEADPELVKELQPDSLLIAFGAVERILPIPGVEGEKVQLVGFGTFEVSERAAREGRNPRSGEVMHIAASKAPKFKAGKALKDIVNE